MQRIPEFKRQNKIKNNPIYIHFSDRKKLKEYETKSVLYLLCRLKRVIYVGKTNNISQRATSHYKKRFDFIVLILCDNEDKAANYEKEAILFFQPAFNKIGKKYNVSIKNTKCLLGRKVSTKKNTLDTL